MRRRHLACALLAFASLPALAADIPVAVAANFAGPMKEIARAFEQASGHHVQVAVGSTGALYAQIRNGAPFELLLAADEATPERLAREGLALPETRFTYAIGRLVLWSATPGRVDDQGRVLRTGDFDRLAIANPRLAPYGAAALQAIDHLGLSSRLQPRLVQAESIGQAYQFVASGSAPLGFVALSQVQRDGRITPGSAWVVPQALYTPLRQDAIVLQPGREQPAAKALLEFLHGDTARAIIRAHGYGL